MATDLRVTYTPDSIDDGWTLASYWNIGEDLIATVSYSYTAPGYLTRMKLWRWQGARSPFTLVDTVDVAGGALITPSDYHHSPDGRKALVVYRVPGEDFQIRHMQGFTLSDGGITAHAAFLAGRDEVVGNPALQNQMGNIPARVANDGTWTGIFATNYAYVAPVSYPAHLHTFEGNMTGITQTGIAGRSLHSFGFGDASATSWPFHQPLAVHGTTLDGSNGGLLVQGKFDDGVNPEIIWHAFCELEPNGDITIRSSGTHANAVSGYMGNDLGGGFYWIEHNGLPMKIQYPNGIRNPGFDTGSEIATMASVFGHYVRGDQDVSVVGDTLNLIATWTVRDIDDDTQRAGPYRLRLTMGLSDPPTSPTAFYLTYSSGTVHLEGRKAFIAIADDGQPMIAVAGRAPKLRQRQRDDNERVPYTSARNHPTSRQASIRMSDKNTYW